MNTSTMAWTKSTKEENSDKLQRVRKKAVLDALVAVFPAGNGLTLLASLARTCLDGETGSEILDGDVFF